MAKYSVVKIEHSSEGGRGTEYMVYWEERKHNHRASTDMGKWAMSELAQRLNVPPTELHYRPRSFQSNQSRPPTGMNVVQIP